MTWLIPEGSLTWTLMVTVFWRVAEGDQGFEDVRPVVSAIKLILGVVCCYLTISFILQTKDDVRFVIPYVEFAKQVRGVRPLLMDTSALIDGRIDNDDLVLLVGFGGGSAMDAAKAIAGLLRLKQSVLDFLEGVGPELP